MCTGKILQLLFFIDDELWEKLKNSIKGVQSLSFHATKVCQYPPKWANRIWGCTHPYIPGAVFQVCSLHYWLVVLVRKYVK